MNRRHKQTGFTLIELMLAMTFISMLLLAIALTTIQLSNMYTKGVTLKSVNEAGRSVGAALQRDVASSRPFDVTPDDEGAQLITNAGTGRLCMGQISYAWTYGENIVDESDVIRYNDGGIVRLARVTDSGRRICNDIEAPVERSRATELLVSSDSLELALHELAITSSASDSLTGQALYNIKFVVGTNEQEALSSGNTSCQPPNQEAGNWQFCAVNVFNIVARAGNRE